MNSLRPYWAIIVDSFRESLHSKVLWCLLGLITFLLLAMAPVGISFSNATHLHHSDIEETVKFAQQLRKGGTEPIENPRYRIWDHLSDDLQKELVKLATDDSAGRGERFRVRGRLVKELNTQIDSDELFNQSQIDSLTLDKEGQRLAAIPFAERKQPERRRLNRLAIAACYPRYFRKGASEAMQITYLGIPVSDPLPVDRDLLDTGVKYGLVVFMSVFAAPLGVFTAILVTASIIPNMFDAGSVNLLFSKPINRSLLYLTKFLGGCWFVFINATYLIVGVWLVIGWRIGIWHDKLLWVIPVLTFLFAVYYSVSAFAGIVWRNTIMCITAAVLFWAACFAVGTLHEVVDGLLVQPQRIIRIVDAHDATLVVKETGEVARWQDDTQQWLPALGQVGGEMGPAFARRNRLLGPIYDSDAHRVLAIHRNFSNSRVIAGNSNDDYQRQSIDTAPANSIALLAEPNLISRKSNNESDEKVDSETKNDAQQRVSFIVVERDGISRLVPKKGPSSQTLDFFGAKYTLGPKRGSFVSIGPAEYEHTRDATEAVMNASDGNLYIYAPGMLHRLTLSADDPHTGNPRAGGRYQVIQERSLWDDKTEAILAVGGTRLLIAPEEGNLELLDSASLETTRTFPIKDHQVPRFAAASNDGRFFCIVFHDQSAWCYDAEADQVISGQVPRQGSITALAFDHDGGLLVASDPPQVETYDLVNRRVTSTKRASYPLLDSIHYYAIRPFYRAFPKPGRLKETAEYLMMDRTTIPQGPDRSLSGMRAQFRPWKPVWEGAIFMVVMLRLACIYIQRQEL